MRIQRIARASWLAGCLTCFAAAVFAESPASSDAARFESLTPELTLDEAIDMLGGTGFATQPVPRLGIPAFPFGFGLTYTTFEYSNLRVEPLRGQADANGPLYTVSFDVRNAGTRAAADVAQLYVGELKSKVARPIRELKGFARTQLDPGETRRVSLQLDARSFAYYDVASRSWRAEAGTYRVELGQSAENISTSAVVELRRPLRVRL